LELARVCFEDENENRTGQEELQDIVKPLFYKFNREICYPKISTLLKLKKTKTTLPLSINLARSIFRPLSYFKRNFFIPQIAMMGKKEKGEEGYSSPFLL
jgi:hypothetical protein